MSSSHLTVAVHHVDVPGSYTGIQALANAIFAMSAAPDVLAAREIAATIRGSHHQQDLRRHTLRRQAAALREQLIIIEQQLAG